MRSVSVFAFLVASALVLVSWNISAIELGFLRQWFPGLFVLLALVLIFVGVSLSRRQRVSSQGAPAANVYQLIAQSAQVALVFDSDCRFLLASDGAKKLLKLSDETQLGEKYSPFAMPDATLNADVCPLHQALVLGRSINAVPATIWPEKSVAMPVTCSISAFQEADVERWLLVIRPETSVDENTKNDKDASGEFSLREDALGTIRDLLRDITENNLEEGDRKDSFFFRVLEKFILATDSEYGFVGRVCREAGAPPFLKTLAITDIAWDEASRKAYQGEGMVFSNLDTLFGQVITSEQTVISNTPASDERAGGIPAGHPALNSFLGIPLMVSGCVIGMVGLANRTSGYDMSLVSKLQVFIDIAAQLTHFYSLQTEYTELRDRYQSLYDSGPVMYVITESRNGEAFIADCNEYFCIKLQFERSALLGRPLRELYDQESQELLGDEYAQACEKGILDVDRTLVAQDGSKIRTKLFAVPYSFGQLHGTRAGYLDMTAQKNAEIETSQATQAIFELLDTLELALMVVDQRGKLVSRNQGAIKLFGSPLEVIMALASTSASVNQMFQDAIKKGTSSSSVFELKDSAGVMKDVSVSVWPIANATKEVKRVLFVGQRLSRVMKAEINNAAIALEYKWFVENANAPIFGVDLDGRINEWNQMAELLTGFKKIEIVGRKVALQLADGDERSSFQKMLTEALQGQRPPALEVDFHNQSDKQLRLLLNTTSRVDSLGNVVGALVFGQDVTQMRENERRLSEAQRLEALGQLTGGIAHDFNNLLTIIQGNLGIIRSLSSSLPEDVEISLADSESAALDGQNLTKQLLGFAKRRPSGTEMIELDLAIESALGMFARSLPGKVSTAFRSATSKIAVNVDSAMLESSLLNLFINSRDASAGAVSIEIDTYLTVLLEGESLDLEAGRYAMIAVTDRGQGIDESILNKVCEPFFSTKGFDNGSGLGLSMVHDFVMQSKGRLEIDSVVGKGTTVTIALPVAEASAGNELAGTTGSKSPRYRKILVVDDEERVRRMAGRLLYSFGFEVVESENADDALRALSMNSDIDMVLTDIVMPGSINGRELANRIAAEYPQIRVLLATGFDDSNIDLASMDWPILPKPYTAEELEKAIASVVRSQNVEGVTNRGR